MASTSTTRRAFATSASIAMVLGADASARGWARAGGTDADGGHAPDHALPGPYRVRTLPQLEHTCDRCFPMCTGLSCLTRIKVYVPRTEFAVDALFPVRGVRGIDAGASTSEDGSRGDVAAPYPVAIITPGFLIDGDAYATLARRLCSWGFVAVTYTKTESVAGGTLDDDVSAAILDDLISWIGSDVLLSPYADSQNVYLIGHSRGGKISMLQATRDDRVKAVCLLDPVDNTVYAPIAPGYPSSLAVMEANPSRVPPIAIVGGVNGGECAPASSNYEQFFAASPSGAVARDHPPWGISCGAGHFDFVDEATFVQKVICPEGTLDATATRDLSAAIAVAHGERIFRPLPAYGDDDAVLDRVLVSLRNQWIDRGIDFTTVRKM
ncbi:putative submergence induced protein 2 [Ostreococcus tauri]|uniref:Putative submergence induced protein 2 n=1 Tax=Ostreococcus tauri TaxID=70448 RepID=A0A1Y5IAV8_OSTTA|nr:putative submergence induced protein 2 [Ostreococcus tauri]